MRSRALSTGEIFLVLHYPTSIPMVCSTMTWCGKASQHGMKGKSARDDGCVCSPPNMRPIVLVQAVTGFAGSFGWLRVHLRETLHHLSVLLQHRSKGNVPSRVPSQYVPVLNIGVDRSLQVQCIHEMQPSGNCESFELCSIFLFPITCMNAVHIPVSQLSPEVPAIMHQSSWILETPQRNLLLLCGCINAPFVYATHV